MRSFPRQSFAAKLEASKEAVYVSSRRSPLGKSYRRGFVIPDGLGTDVPFGTTTKTADLSPLGCSDGQHSVHEKAANRVDWQQLGIDIASHRFGSVPKMAAAAAREGSAVKLAMTSHQISSSPRDEALDSSSFRQHLTDVPLGRTKHIIPGISVDEEAVYGRPSKRDADGVAAVFRDVWNSVEGTTQAAAVSHRHEDASPTGGSKDRVDINLLMNPLRYSESGLGPDSYHKLRGKAELKSVLSKAGVEIDPASFEEIFHRASSKDGSPDTSCSFSTFLHFRQHQLRQTKQKE